MTDSPPATAEELEDELNSGDLQTRFFEANGQAKPEFSAFLKKYAAAHARRDNSIAEQIRNETLKAHGEILRNGQIEHINRLNLSPEARTARNPHYQAKAPGAKLDDKFGNWTDFMSALWSGNVTQESLQARSEIKRIMNSFGSTVPSDGGFLVPETLRAELLRVALETAVVRSRARVVPMETLTVPYPMIDSITNSGSVYGGIVGYWTEEGGALTDSSPKFGRVTLSAKKLTIYSEIPNELFADSLLSLQQFMAESFPEALSFFEDMAFFSGTGVGEPLGFQNAPAAVSVAAETNQPAGSLVYQNLNKMFSRMLPSSINRAVWVAHIDTFPELATMALSVGTGGGPVWIGNGGMAGTPPMTIWGRPVIFTEKSETVGTAGDIAFVDFGYYLIGDRQMMQSETSTHYQFGNDKTAVRVIERVDGRPWINSPITPAKGSNTLSPFVNVVTRS